MEEIICKNANGETETAKISDAPDNCPLCHRSINPVFVYGYIKGSYPNETLELIYRCPDKKCNRLFIAYYYQYPHQSRGVNNYFYLNSTAPWIIPKRDFSEIIKKTSKSFCNIYNQALAAEKRGLLEICGAGYRKALEFLIKDYSIKKHKNDKDKVKRMLLGKCIETYIDESRIKNCAKRAAWLGNDEVHYYRRWTDKNLEDLKNLMELTVNWIEIVLRSDKYTKGMSE